MGKRGGAKKLPITPNPSHSSVSLREETSGRIQTKGASRNPRSFLKLEHLQNLAVWAGKEAAIPSLGAFFGRQFAAAGEVLGVSPNPSVILCQRCETILQPGFNCTVRIERNQKKARRRQKKHDTPMQNSVVYKCHLCSHHNLKRGTPKGHLKEICPSKPKPKPSAKSETCKPMAQKSVSFEKVTKSKDDIALPPPTGDPSILNSPVTPSVRSGLTLLDAKRRKRTRSGSKKSEESESNNGAEGGERTFGALSKRKRKSWTSLKEITESNENDNTRKITNLTVPFLI